MYAGGLCRKAGKGYWMEELGNGTMKVQDRRIQLTKGSLCLSGILGLPAKPAGVVLFEHESGNRDPGNRKVGSFFRCLNFQTSRR